MKTIVKGIKPLKYKFPFNMQKYNRVTYQFLHCEYTHIGYTFYMNDDYFVLYNQRYGWGGDDILTIDINDRVKLYKKRFLTAEEITEFVLLTYQNSIECVIIKDYEKRYKTT